MSFSFDTKNELCRLPVQRLCCARAEAYGILLYCNTFQSAEVRVVTENPNFAARLPRLFHRAFGLRFDRQPEPGAEGKLARRVTKAEYRAAAEHLANCGITDGYTQERTSAREEYTPDFDLSGL